MQLPEEFKERMQKIIVDYDDFLKSLEEENEKAICVNTHKVSVADFEKLAPFPIQKIPDCANGFYLHNDCKIGRHPYHHAGLFYSQDPGAQATINTIEIKENMRVLDLCAAPGGKSIQVAQQLTKGFLVANEINKKRAQILYSNIERMGLSNVMITSSSAKDLSEVYQGYFDLVIVDAPCSGEGMFRKDEEAISQWSVENVKHCCQRQKEILHYAASMVKTNGHLLYSTCTYEKEENEDMVEWFCKNYHYTLEPIKELGLPGLSGKECRRFYPHKYKGEGQFVAYLKNDNKIEEKVQPRTEKRANSKVLDEFLTHLSKPHTLYVKNQKVFEMVDPSGTHVVSSGVQFGEIKGNYFLPNHYLFSAYGKEFDHQLSLPLHDPRIEAYLRGEEIEADIQDGYGVLLVDGYVLGGFKATKGKLKNHYPKGLRNL